MRAHLPDCGRLYTAVVVGVVCCGVGGGLLGTVNSMVLRARGRDFQYYTIASSAYYSIYVLTAIVVMTRVAVAECCSSMVPFAFHLFAIIMESWLFLRVETAVHGSVIFRMMVCYLCEGLDVINGCNGRV